MDFQQVSELDPTKIFSRIKPEGPVIVAVSGGSDSIAMLLLASAWSKHANVELHAVTIDHGLRPEAAAEAGFVSGTCEGLGISHVTLAWEGLKPNTGLPEASRSARYQLLEEFAGDLGACCVLTAHTADDQSETVFMRLLRESANGSGRGLSGMAFETRMPKGVALIRPLLGFSRNTLRQYLAHHLQSWIEDPSNSDPSYERVQVRQYLRTNLQLKDDLLDFSAVVGRQRALIAKEATVLLHHSLKFRRGLVYELNLMALKTAPKAVMRNALQVLLAVAGGAEHLVSAAKLDPVLGSLLIDRADGDTYRQTIGNCVLSLKGDKLIVYREARNLGPLLLGPGDKAIWDGRFQITNDTASPLYVGPLDRGLLIETETVLSTKFKVSPRAALYSLPAFRCDGDDVYLPLLFRDKLPNGIHLKMVSRAIEQFSPDFDRPLVEWFNSVRQTIGNGQFTEL